MSASGSGERVNQKSRTRAALLQAARDLVATGATPSVAEVADAALVSRATAYRYFPSRDALLLEAHLDEDLAVEALFDEQCDHPVGDRAATVFNALYDHAIENESRMRLFLRTTLDRWLSTDGQASSMRGGRRVVMLDEALEPLQGSLGADELRRLRCALSLLAGIESLVVARDVLDLTHEEARGVGEWAVRALVEAVERDLV